VKKLFLEHFYFHEKQVVLTGVADSTGELEASFVILCGSDNSSTQRWPKAALVMALLG